MTRLSRSAAVRPACSGSYHSSQAGGGGERAGDAATAAPRAPLCVPRGGAALKPRAEPYGTACGGARVAFSRRSSVRPGPAPPPCCGGGGSGSGSGRQGRRSMHGAEQRPAGAHPDQWVLIAPGNPAEPRGGTGSSAAPLVRPLHPADGARHEASALRRAAGPGSVTRPQTKSRKDPPVSRTAPRCFVPCGGRAVPVRRQCCER